MKPYIYIMTLTLFFFSCTSMEEAKVTSPDKKITVQAGEENGRIYYSISKNNTPVLDKSFLGFTFKTNNFENVHISKVIHSSFSETWEQVWGEEITVDNTYNQMIVSVEESEGLKRKFDIVFRVFDDGIGFRYEFPAQENMKEFTIIDENTEFNFTEAHKSWSIPYGANYYEALYEPKPLNRIDTVSTPLTIETENGLFLAVHEANLTDYASMNLTPQNGTSKLKVYLTPWSTGEKVFMKTPGVTPWRTIIIAGSLGDLLLSRLMLNLNESNRINDTSWIKTGRYIGIWWGMHMEKYTWTTGPKHGAITANVKRYIDFAAKHGFSGVLVEGWNTGWENNWTVEGDKFSFTTAYPDFDLEEVTRYAASKGVSLIGHHETGGATLNYESQMDSAFALYNKYGVSVVKTGYVSPLLDGKERNSSQYGVRHYRKVIETAAKYKIMIDNHEPVMPTGLQRTYPNLMTQEGVRGQEWDAWSTDGGNPPEHTTIIPFTRGLAGPMDFTPGTFLFENPVFPDTRVWTTLAKQLALSVVIYSPQKTAYEMIENYENNPAFEFITSCPTNWSETVVPDAKIGEYVTIARKDRESRNWFIGSITNAEARTLNLGFAFLENGVKYKAKIFRDGKDAHYKTNPYPIEIEEMEITSETNLTIPQAPGGGTAIMLIHPNT